MKNHDIFVIFAKSINCGYTLAMKLLLMSAHCLMVASHQRKSMKTPYVLENRRTK